ncbi:Only proline and serine are matching in the corresponding protein [Coniochaeta hoffmannii]|uniref:Only proline and serine are matching in the corresponding protein n=1 Tax=Coniochaeta hoffmannii TaxID=91930 RepID=A0AA38VIB7_9PEZI|nr:Only proline and serine are matching in the corresponding protein [Coniochaeta hoffmannii]
MALRLKPLLLPQLVEQRRKHESLVQQGAADADQDFIYYTHHSSSSSSDIASRSPITPTFSRTHSRYSGSTSSLEQLSSSYSETPASPTQATNSIKNGKSLLPDVQEDPLREDEHTGTAPADEQHRGLYDCLCDEPCMHHDADPDLGNNFAYPGADMDYYDLGFMSDSDFSIDERAKKQRTVDESPFAGLTRRVSSKISSHVGRWRSNSKRSNFNFSAASEPSLDHGMNQSRAVSRAASSRSSSISTPGRYIPDRSNEPPLPPTPALSFYESTENVAPAEEVLDIEQPDVRQSLERERALAATPLLPPLLIERPALSAPASLHASPLQSPTVAMASMTLHETTPTPPLSSKPSVSSFHPAPSMLSPTSPLSELPSPMPNMIEHDEWSDRLGHANFTIVPLPYRPTAIDLEALTSLRADWDLAKVNYTKHLCRTGEHYGMTSNTYTLTQAKWAEIEREWRAAEADLVDRIVRASNGQVEPADLLRRGRREEVQPAVIPKMIEGKFPERGDVDIVGPMQRDAVMIRAVSSRDVSPIDDRKHVSAWLRSLAGKVGLRK